MTTPHATILRGTTPHRVELHSHCVGLTGVLHASKALVAAGALSSRDVNALTGLALGGEDPFSRGDRLAAAALALAAEAAHERADKREARIASERAWLSIVLAEREARRQRNTRPCLRAAALAGGGSVGAAEPSAEPSLFARSLPLAELLPPDSVSRDGARRRSSTTSRNRAVGQLSSSLLQSTASAFRVSRRSAFVG